MRQCLCWPAGSFRSGARVGGRQPELQPRLVNELAAHMPVVVQCWHLCVLTTDNVPSHSLPGFNSAAVTVLAVCLHPPLCVVQHVARTCACMQIEAFQAAVVKDHKQAATVLTQGLNQAKKQMAEKIKAIEEINAKYNQVGEWGGRDSVRECEGAWGWRGVFEHACRMLCV